MKIRITIEFDCVLEQDQTPEQALVATRAAWAASHVLLSDIASPEEWQNIRWDIVE